MRVSEQQRANAAIRSVEARKKAREEPGAVDWDEQLRRLRVMLKEVYGRRRG